MNLLKKYFADLHIHIGRDMYDHPVKITASKNLTLTNILIEASRRKGIDIVGVIDSQAPAVQEEIQQLIKQERAYELQDGGIRFENVTLFLGAEIEVYDHHCQGPIHVLCYFPSLELIGQFTKWLKAKMKNVHLSSQRFYGSAIELQEKVAELQGLFIPAHVFTPFKSVYGKGVKRSIKEILDVSLIDAIELGLSSDTLMADQIKELHTFTFVTNSDSHSLAKIGREYQQILLKEPTFLELKKALHHKEGRKIIANFGMNPRLGKYYSTVCKKCMTKVQYKINTCPNCGSSVIVNGVYDRIKELKNTDVSPKRPKYYYQVPLEYLPGLGPKTFETLLQHFGTEMNVIHHVPMEELEKVVPKKIAILIHEMREGKQQIKAGGGGKYGKIK